MSFLSTFCWMFCALFLQRYVAAIFNISHPLWMHTHTHILTLTNDIHKKRKRLHSDAYIHSIIFCYCRLQIFVCVIFLVVVFFLILYVFVVCLLIFFCFSFMFFFFFWPTCVQWLKWRLCNESTSFVFRFGCKIILVRFVVVVGFALTIRR